jgi:hypothetical protein
MALVIEDGTGVANATSFATLAEMRAYGLARGVALPTDDAELEVLAVKAVDYIKSRRADFGGNRLTDTQALPFPRTNQSVNDVIVADGEIPQEVIDLQCGIVLELNNGVDFFPASNERLLKRSKTGPIEKEWFDRDITPNVSSVEALIAPLLSDTGGFSLTVRRV